MNDYFTYNYKYFLIGALALVLLFRMIRSARYKNVNIWREIFILALVLYVAFLSIQTFEGFNIRVNGFHPLYNLEPFKSIKTMFTIGMKYNGPETMHLHISTIYINLLGNVLIFAPVGFLSAFLFKEPKWYKSLLAGLSLSLTIEIVQLFLLTRSFDVDDLILNGFGTLLGYLFFRLLALMPWFKRFTSKTGSSDRPHGWQWATVLILAIVGWALAIFLQQYRGILKLPLG